ncbi:MAG TPA: class II fructose-bisphosphate aldolase [Verrucomicrobiae bacterium]|nr:class II fructose-bisphosphate aldolase [Verrucomicrobiae bacterium]
MKLLNAKQICDQAAAKGFGIPALNNNGGDYDIGRAIIEVCEELRSPLIIQCYEPNLEYRGYDFAGLLIKFLAANTTIPIAIALDHGKTPQSVMRAVRAGFTHVMIDYAEKPMDENIRGTQQIIDLVRPLGVSVEAEIGHIIKSSDASDQRAPTVEAQEAKEFASRVDVDLLAVAVGSTHGIFKEQHGLDFGLMTKIHSAVKPPLVLHGTCGISMADISKSVKAGMTKINFGEGMRMNYIKYFNEFSQTLNHEHHVWRIARAAKDRLKEDLREIVRAVGSEGKADQIKIA